jgi:hypothetical protein
MHKDEPVLGGFVLPHQELRHGNLEREGGPGLAVGVANEIIRHDKKARLRPLFSEEGEHSISLGLHPLSRALIRSAIPRAVASTTYATIGTPTWYEFQNAKGGLEELVREIAPGLTRAQLGALGYSVVDADANQTLVSVPPAVAAQG